jgi:hypothetical protein
MRRLLPIAALSLLSSGCALFADSSSPNAYAPEKTRIVADGRLEPASLAAPRPAGARGPVGLAPCAKKSFPARNCWRKGDEHVLFPSQAPLGMQANGEAIEPLEVSAKQKRRIDRLRDFSD